MLENKNTTMDFDDLVKEVIANMKKHEYQLAYQYILKALNADLNRPEPQNLLGIWYEMNGDDTLARKHYRMAYVLDPIYKPASANLERVSTVFPIKYIPIDYGETMTEEIIKEEKTTVTKVKG